MELQVLSLWCCSRCAVDCVETTDVCHGNAEGGKTLQNIQRRSWREQVRVDGVEESLWTTQQIEREIRCCFSLFSMSISSRSRQDKSRISLTANRSTRYQETEVDDNFLDLVYEPREVSRLIQNSQEVDLPYPPVCDAPFASKLSKSGGASYTWVDTVMFHNGHQEDVW